MEITNHFWMAVAKSFTHFLSSGVAGLLVYYLTLTTLTSLFRKKYQLQHKTSLPRQVSRGITLCSLSFALLASIALHIYIDFGVPQFSWWIFTK